MLLKNKIKELISNQAVDYWFVAIFSAFLGFFRLGYQSLWNDESISIMWAAKKPLLWIWENIPKVDLHPPLYYSILHFWQLIFSDSVVSIRGLSVFFFIGSCILAYYLAKLIFASRRVAVLTAIIFITNPFALYYAQEVRSYSMLIFFVLLNTLFFYKINYLQHLNKKNYLIYFLTALILIYTNILSLFALTTHFLILLFRKDHIQLKRFILLYIFLGICYLPAFRILKNANEFDYSYYNKERYGVFLKTVVAISGFIGAKINIWNGKRHIYGLLAASLVAYSAVLTILLFKIKQANRFLLSFFLVSFTLIMIAAHIKFPVPDPKYFFVSFPFFIFLIGNVFTVINKRWLLAASFLLVLIFNCIFLYDYFFVKKYEKENWKSVIAMVESDYLSERSHSALSISPVAEPHTTWQYYSRDIIPAAGALKYGNVTSSIYKALDESNTPPKDIIYLSRFIWELYDPSDAIRQYFEGHGYMKTRIFQDTKVEYWRLDKKNN